MSSVNNPTDENHFLLSKEEESKEFIRKLLEEDEKALATLKEQREAESVFICKICYEQLDSEESEQILPLQLCEHIFHQECMEQYLQTQIEGSLFPLHCPDHKCRKDVSDSDLRECLNEQTYQRYSVFALNQVIDSNPDLSWCPTPDCKYAFVFAPNTVCTTETKTISEEKSSCANELKCPLCEHHYCLTCRVKFHTDLTCEQYQN